MCLYIGNRKPLVAQRDIVVYKYVEIVDGKFMTPFQYAPVNLNSLMVAGGGSGDITEKAYEKYIINGGAIHACTSSNDGYLGEECVCLKAIIKKGTEFWVQDDFKEVAARSLYITDEVVYKNETSDFKDIYVSILENAKKHKHGIKVGHFLLADKTYASPLSEFDHSKAIAVVIGFNPHDDSPIHVALDEISLLFLTYNYFKYNNSCCSDISDDKVLKMDFDGYKHTYDIANAKDYKAHLFQTIDYCINYSTKGTNKGDWYLGAVGEIFMLAQNLTIVNAAILLNNIGTCIKINTCFWTSSQYRDVEDKVCSWAVSMACGSSSAYRHGWHYGFQVRPLLVFNNKRKRSYVKILRNKLLNLFKKNRN